MSAAAARAAPLPGAPLYTGFSTSVSKAQSLISLSKMERSSALALLPLLLLLLRAGSVTAAATGAPDGMERWGYVEVRPKAHLFWWFYKSSHGTGSNSSSSPPWPTVLWLQGGPGASGVGLGNFLEIGPLDVDLKPRASTWLQKADLLFVDNPVGTGYSYVEGGDESLLVRTDEAAAEDMVALLRGLGDEVPSLQSSPLFLVAESYGGKYAATLGVAVAKAVQAGGLRLTLGGVALGDSWISPGDFTVSYAPLLLQVSRLDNNGAAAADKRAQGVQEMIATGQFKQAELEWNAMLFYIKTSSGSVDVYNFLLDEGMDPVTATASSSPESSPATLMRQKYSKYLSEKAASASKPIDGIMNGAIKEKLKIIPKDLVWQEVANDVYDALSSDMMKPRINEVDELLSYGVNVTVYNGQLDVICSTIGAETWVQKLKWDGLENFLSLPRQPLSCGSAKGPKAFVRSYKNLHFYWILGAGHFVPVDQPCIALNMIGSITQSPAPPTT